MTERDMTSLKALIDSSTPQLVNRSGSRQSDGGCCVAVLLTCCYSTFFLSFASSASISSIHARLPRLWPIAAFSTSR